MCLTSGFVSNEKKNISEIIGIAAQIYPKVANDNS